MLKEGDRVRIREATLSWMSDRRRAEAGAMVFTVESVCTVEDDAIVSVFREDPHGEGLRLVDWPAGVFELAGANDA